MSEKTLHYGEDSPEAYTLSDSVAVFVNFRDSTIFNEPVFIHRASEEFYIKRGADFILIDDGMENFQRFSKLSPEQDIEDAQNRQRKFETTAQPNGASRLAKLAGDAHRRTMESTLGRK
jgi:hypothetical protein